ncbi:ATP-binding protein [Aliiglaciecola sp. 3_MG-2023]|uniref:sensor histidine kinase n=1 Tax=Aliiglaciecola sp. 3_MG-2023 TaxID=3062644 RepID=UPI0026E43534|nr:sensor histidine kinase [Aliiglaciecola sp. 3_MG-2023]MDO6693853.1 ATP-binding protein [Aliiglaciecola sp. 3_MG-2023]
MRQRRLFGNTVFTWFTVTIIVLGVISVNAYLAVKTTRDLAKVQESLTNTGNVILVLDELHIMILAAESSQRGYLLTEIEEYLAPYISSVKQLSEQIEKVRVVNVEIVGQKALIDEIIKLTEMKMDEMEKAVALAQSDRERSAIRLVKGGEGNELTKDLGQLFSQIIDNELSYRNFLYSKLNRSEKESVFTFFTSAITSALLLLGLIVLARLNLVSEEKFRNSLEQQNENLALKVEERTQTLTLYSEELARSNRELEDFAFVASHDLQEPLRKIRAFGDRLQSDYSEKLGEKGADYLNRMKNAAERMSNLISDLLEFSRVSTRGKDFTDVDMSTVIEAIESDLEIAIEESKTQLIVSQLPTIKGDPSQLNQLFLNLLSNAIKFRKPEVAPIIELQYKLEENPLDNGIADGDMHVFTIKDNGVGFENEFAEKIFVPFQRLHGRNEYKGTGIGLAVCRRIVERHGGTISATSELGKGSVFVIKLPTDAVLNKIESN